ncbi:MAG TPA: DUF3047 domain-containing protein [Noviherbaspirillum sp.]|nr:DUF3047 domain-containing protein [Noviherbaspirillum sp.]
MSRFIFSLVSLIALAGCAVSTHDVTPPLTASASAQQDQEIISLFSSHPAGGMPEGWEPLIILRTKKQTQYQLVRQENTTVLHARAEGSSSGLMQRVSIDPHEQPWLHWDWRIGSLIKKADNTQRATEDSPVRIILGFDGDKDSLPFADQIMFETAKVLTGHDFPYATLMYIWENSAPVGTIIRSAHSGRIKMMVAARGEDGIGEWRNFARNIVADYEKAFGEKPGKLIGVGVLSDTDNTGEVIEAWYGDIRFLRERASLAVLRDFGSRSLSLGQSE